METRTPWDQLPWQQRSDLVAAARAAMAADLQRPQQGPQRLVKARAALVDIAEHNDLQADAIPALMAVNLTPYAARIALYALQDAIRDGDASVNPAVADEIAALMAALASVGNFGDLMLPDDPDAYDAASAQGLTDRLTEQAARAAYEGAPI